jgi:DNA repair protein RecN (Recombination protein N)
MLRALRIANFAIIDELALEFAPGLNVLTGETGAGKSIIMQALGLLCGSRGAVDLIRSGADEAELEAVFDLDEDASRAAEQLGIPTGGELSLRRVITRSGKGRIHLNGSSSTLAVLSQLGLRLLHIYGQHEHALLLQPDSHLDLLDDFGRLRPLRQQLSRAFQELSASHQRYRTLTTGGAAARERAELLQFQIEELQAADPGAGEEARLLQEREILRHTERLLQTSREGEELLYSGDGAAASVAARVLGQLRELSRIDPQLGEITQLIETAHAQLDEAALRLRRYADTVSGDPDRLGFIDERLALLRRMARKHDCPVDELAERLGALQQERARVTGAGLDLDSARNAMLADAEVAWNFATQLSAARQVAARQLERKMVGELRSLGMEGAIFTVHLAGPPDSGRPSADDPFALGEARLSERGGDRVEFHLSANRGEDARALARVASGGELSRIMLALKALTAGAGEVDTLVFDEVDAGIGGVVAETVGGRLKELSRNRQLLCITHLPQIAVQADHHFAVEKTTRKGRSVTAARHLGKEERVAELSRMLGSGLARREAERYARRLVEEARGRHGG